jgi:hypothetical protein
MEGNQKLEPARELLDKVIFLADAKAKLPFSERAGLNIWDVYCRVSQLPGGALLYQAGGTEFIAIDVEGSFIPWSPACCFCCFTFVL